MNFMFERAAAFNQLIGEWQTGSVTDMIRMFDGATAYRFSSMQFGTRSLPC